MSCFPKAGYGIELDTPNKGDFRSFRTASARALGLSKKGASPWIALNLVSPKCNDFEHFAMEKTIMFWRQYLRVFPARTGEVKKKLLQPLKKGPIANLHFVLSKVGQVVGDGTLIDTKYMGLVHWTKCSKTHLKQVIRIHWNAFVCNYLTNLPRKNFSCTATDIDGFHCVTRHMSAVDLQIIKSHCCGTNYTNDIKSKYLNTPNKCPLCEETDSKMHRLFHCPGLAEERSKMSQDTINLAHQIPTLAHFALLPISDETLGIRRNLLYHDFGTTVDPVPLGDPTELPHFHIFTDGSCFHNTMHLLSLAGAAYQAYDLVGNQDPCDSSRSILPGKDHNSYRAEAFAILMVCRKYRHCTIYTDCQAVKGELTMIFEAIRQNSVPIFQKHPDIWEAIFAILKQGRHLIKVVKVKAHTEHITFQDPMLAWISRCNARVDHEAKLSITQDNHELFQLFNTHHNMLSKHRQALKEIVHFQVSCAHKIFRSSTKQLDISRESTIYARGHIPDQHLITWNCQLARDSCDDCPICPEFLHRLASWANGIRWQLDIPQHISFFELMLSFIYDTGTHPPYPVKKYPNKPSCRAVIWRLRDQNPTMDFQGFNLGSLLSGFIRTANWSEKTLGIKLFAGEHKPDVTSLSKYGYRAFKAPGFRARPILPKQELVDIFCNKHLPNKVKIEFPIP